MPRYALLLHDSPRGLHYDLLLERGVVLKTWALPHLPAESVELECDALPDHRLLYLEYEGPISADRGTVARCDSGTFEVETWTDSEVVVELFGDKLAGRVALRRTLEDSAKWRFFFTARHPRPEAANQCPPFSAE